MGMQAGSRIERREAERLGGGGADDLPDIDAHGIGDDFEFVDEADVDGAVDVFQQLGEFRDLARADGDDRVEGRLIQGHARIQASRGVTADDLGDVGGGEFRVAGILALRGVNHEHRFPGNQPAGDHAGDDLLVRGAGISGALQGENGTGLQMRDDGGKGVADVGKIRLEVMVERSGNTEDDGIGLGDAEEIGGGVELATSEGRRNVGSGDVLDITLTTQEMELFGFIDVEADHTEPGAGIGEQQRQADIAETDNGDGGGLGGEGRRHGVKLKS